MRKINWLIVVVVLVLTACGGAAAGDDAASQAAQPTATQAVQASAEQTDAEQTDAGKFDVKVIKAGSELAAYQQVTSSPSALFDGQLLQLYLNSPDNQHVLTVDIQGTEAGVYPLAVQYEAAKAGESSLDFMTSEPPVLIPAQGEVKLDAFDGQTCSGSFRSTGTDIDGVDFSIEGSFSNLLITKGE